MEYTIRVQREKNGWYSGQCEQVPEANDCLLLREGSNHSLCKNTVTGAISSVPRHPDIWENTVKNICKQLGIPKI